MRSVDVLNYINLNLCLKGFRFRQYYVVWQVYRYNLDNLYVDCIPVMIDI